MSDKIIVIGSCNTDMVIKAKRLPVPGETILGGTFMMNPGGKGANQAVAVARLGGAVTFVSKTGNDLFGRQSLELYNSEGICTDFVFSDAKNPSGVALITVDEAGENCIVVASGANASLSVEDIQMAEAKIAQAGIMLMQLEVPLPTVEYAASLASKHGVKVVLNPAPACALSDSLLKEVCILTPNRTEAEMLSGIKVTDWASARQAADVISAKGVDVVIITLGAAGSLIKEGAEYHQVAAHKVQAVDTTAAGDTFNGALCVALSEGRDVVQAVEFASKAAAIAVTRMGAQSSIPYRKELQLSL